MSFISSELCVTPGRSIKLSWGPSLRTTRIYIASSGPKEGYSTVRDPYELFEKSDLKETRVFAGAIKDDGKNVEASSMLGVTNSIQQHCCRRFHQCWQTSAVIFADFFIISSESKARWCRGLSIALP